MNKTKIDWADMTWNLVTGCLHGCEYCYARRIAERFGSIPPKNEMDQLHVLDRPMCCEIKPILDEPHGTRVDPYPFGFEPTFHRYRLNEPSKIKKPQNIFVCSMADLFGEWVPDEWIETVLYACEESPQHRYLFLTKSPRVACSFFMNNEFFYRNKNWYIGCSVTRQSDNNRIGQLPERFKTFASIEPIMGPIILSLEHLSWLIIGAETGNRKGKVIPEKSWIDDIAEQCRVSNVPIFMKESLRKLMGDDFRQEFPWEVSP